MKIGMQKQNQDILAQAGNFIRRGEIVSYAGIFGTGEDFLYWQLLKQTKENQKKDEIVVPSQLELGTLEEITSQFSTQFKGYSRLGIETPNPRNLQQVVSSILQERKVIIIMYLGYKVTLESNVLEILFRLRNMHGSQLEMVIFTSAGFLLQIDNRSSSFYKLLTSNLHVIAPYTPQDSLSVVAFYEHHYDHKISSKLRAEIVRFSGGSPGLLKGLYQLACGGEIDIENCLQDARLHWRLANIVEELPTDYQESLSKIAVGREPTKSTQSWLRQFRYLTSDNHVFSPLLERYLQQGYAAGDSSSLSPELQFSPKAYKAYQHLYTHLGELINRGALAQAIWGESWEDKYSDWALDKVMSELRKNLAGHPEFGDLVTKRGAGYSLVSRI